MALHYLYHYQRYISLANRERNQISFEPNEQLLLNGLKATASEAINLNVRHKLQLDIRLLCMGDEGQKMVTFAKANDKSLIQYLDYNYKLIYNHEKSFGYVRSRDRIILTITRLLGFIIEVYGAYSMEYADLLIHNFHHNEEIDLSVAKLEMKYLNVRNTRK